MRDGGVYADVTAQRVTLGNSLAERSWNRAALATLELRDKRGRDHVWSRNTPDFRLFGTGAPITSEQFTVTGVQVEHLARGGLRVEMQLTGPAGLTATRIAEAYPGVAGFRTQTVLAVASRRCRSPARRSTRPRSATRPRRPRTTSARARTGAARTTRARRSSSATRRPAHGGRRRRAAAGEPIEANAEWLEATEGERSLAMVMERNDQPSSRARYDGQAARARGRLRARRDHPRPARGERAHREPVRGRRPPARRRRPGEPFALEPAFVALGAHAGRRRVAALRLPRRPPPDAVPEGDHVQLQRHRRRTRSRPARRTTWTSTSIREIAPIARALGIETFILDDGWQARSGDWQPDSPEFPEPRCRTYERRASPTRSSRPCARRSRRCGSACG